MAIQFVNGVSVGLAKIALVWGLGWADGRSIIERLMLQSCAAEWFSFSFSGALAELVVADVYGQHITGRAVKYLDGR